jgi:phenylalanyl-tRNA synthetase alpha chain
MGRSPVRAREAAQIKVGRMKISAFFVTVVPMKRHIISIHDSAEKEALAILEKRDDFKSLRMKKLLALPDLTKKEHSPVKILFDQILNLPRFKDFDIIDFPRIVTVEQDFDLLNTPKDHPSRRETDTYYVTDEYLLRTQMTAMWSFYLKDPEILKRLETEGTIQVLAPGIVFRKDEIDRHHFPAFHQIDGLLICKKSVKVITQDDLKEVQADLAKGIFGPKIEYKFLDDEFPYTVESLEMDIMFNGKWLEVNGAGLVNPIVLRNFGLDPEIYNGWAFGFGERLAMIKMGIPDIRILWSDDPRITKQFKDIDSVYKEVSKYPPVIRDISFVVNKDVQLNNYYEIARDCAVNLIEELKLTDTYKDDKKFGTDKVSYTFRITYRSPERTLTNEEVNAIHDKISEKTKAELGAAVR